MLTLPGFRSSFNNCRQVVGLIRGIGKSMTILTDERYTIGCHYLFIAPARWDERSMRFYRFPMQATGRWFFCGDNFILDRKVAPVLAELFLNLYLAFFISVMRQLVSGTRMYHGSLNIFDSPFVLRDIGEDKGVGKPLKIASHF